MSEAVADVLDDARARVTPAAEERATLESVTERLRQRAQDAVADRSVDADVLLVGSTARDTWLPGDRDVDLFVRFSPDLDRDALREHGLAVGHAVLPDGTEEYAEHPYVTGTVDGVDVDVVPCYDVADATEIQSAVDRTPFHTEYVRERLDDDLATEVRLVKAFCTSVGIYGSDLRTRGFSGYVLELLVLEYGGAREFLSAAADWQPPEAFDPVGHGAAEFDDPLVVIDPTDPERNVAAVCSATNVARLQHHARRFLAEPDTSYFAPTGDGAEVADAVGECGSAGDDGSAGDARLDAEGLREHLERRGTTPLALRFQAPDLVDDDLYPQLRTSLRGIEGLLDRAGFDVLRSTAAVAEGSAVLLLELEVATRPAVDRHEGPPVHVREHAERFYEAYADDPDAYGPFVEGGRYVVERPRGPETATALVESEELFDVGHGAAVERHLEDGFDLLVGEEVVDLLPAFDAELARYFDPRP